MARARSSSDNYRRLAWLLLASTAIAGGLALAAPARAQTAPATEVQSFSLPAQSLQGALDAFSRQTGWQVGYTSDLAAGRTASAVSGAMAPAEALTALLRGTGLTYRATGAGSVLLVPAAGEQGGALILDPVTVAGLAPAAGAGGPARTVIDQAELDRRNPTTVKDVFAGEPTIQVGGSMAASQKVYVDGIEETNLAVSIDGSRQNNKVFHHNGTTLIDPSFMKVVRVDAGVAPADAGPGALGGSIAYETKGARDFLTEDGMGAFVKTSLNSNGPVSITNLSGYAVQQGFDVLAYGTYGAGRDYEDGNGTDVDGTATSLMSGLFKGGYQAETGDRFQISYEHVRDDANRPYRANIGFITGRPAWEPRERNYTLDRSNLAFNWSQTKPSALWDPGVTLAYSRSEVGTDILSWPRTPFVPPGRVRGSGDNESLNGKIHNRFTFDHAPVPGSVNVGADFYHDEAGYSDPTYAASESATNYGLFAQADLRPIDRVRLSTGVRGDRQTFDSTGAHDWTNAGLSYNGSGEVDVVPGILVAKAGYSHVWGGVSLAEPFIMNDTWRYGAGGPDPVTANNVTAGLEATYQGFSVGGRVFRTMLDDARTPRWAAPLGSQTQDVKSKGYELSAGYNWGDGFARVSYADVDVTSNGQPIDSDIGTYLATPMGQFLTIGAGHTVRPWNVTFGADLEIAFENNDVLPGNQPWEGYEVLSLYAEYAVPDFNDLTLRLDVHNVLDETYASRSTYGQEWAVVTPLYEAGRSFILAASARF